MQGIIYFTIIAFILSIIIVTLNNLLNKRNIKEEEILKMLPSYNCGSCGYLGCSDMASEILKDSSALEKCKIAKNKEEILKILKEK